VVLLIYNSVQCSAGWIQVDLLRTVRSARRALWGFATLRVR